MHDHWRIEQADRSDIPAIAAIFTECFYDSVIHHCGRLPKPQAMEDVFTLVYEAEPAAAFVARTGTGQVAGYCFAPARLPCLWIRAVLGGHIAKWVWRWGTGQYGFGLYSVKVILVNKLAFLTSATAPAKAASARILSIAVARSYQGRGAASRLLDTALVYFKAHQAARVRLEVRPDNAAAIRVYEKAGFYRDGFTADSQGPWLIMFKEMELHHV